MAAKEIAGTKDYRRMIQAMIDDRVSMRLTLDNVLGEFAGTSAMATIRNNYKDAMALVDKAIDAANDEIKELRNLG